MKFTVFICFCGKATFSKLKNIAQIYISLQSIDRAEEVLTHLLMKQTERIAGLHDKSLLGAAYAAFNWIKDEEYNEARRLKISQYFSESMRGGTIYKKDNSLYIVFIDAQMSQRWLDIATSISSRQIGESYKWPSDSAVREEYKATARITDHMISDEEVLTGFRHWLQEAKES